MTEKPTLLVIGGEINQQSPLLLHLQSELNIVYAANADQVIDITSDREPLDLVLIDIVSLGEKAYETCMWLKTDTDVKDVPIMVLGEKEEDISRWLGAGAVDLLCRSTPVGLAAARIKSQLELKYKTNLLVDLASLDGLTTLINKQRLDDYLDIEWCRSLREFYPLSLVKIDIDSFTAYNDYYGIGNGDDALKRIARALMVNCSRAGDMLSRYGADEFVVLLPAIELDNALIVAERMVSAVSALTIDHELSAFGGRLTISAGVATIEPSRDKRCQDMFDEAEEMLYRAQQSGGNQAQGISI
ncbi:MAG: diguanylate cyclase [Pseudomonadales bacterium]